MKEALQIIPRGDYKMQMELRQYKKERALQYEK
jgi:hypothetical protein